RNFAIASVVKIVEPSRDRAELDFYISESRGGIPLVEYKYTKQLAWKRDRIKKDLAKIARLDNIKVNDTIGMENPFRYRNHTQIPVGYKNGETDIGFYKINSKSIVDMEGSILQPELGDKMVKIIRDWMKKHNIKPYNRRSR